MKFAKSAVKHRIPILIAAVLLMLPSFYCMAHTRINYDMLAYLPDDMDTVKGQNELMEDFGKGAFSFIVVEGMPVSEVSALKSRIEQVEHVETVLWYDSVSDVSVPMELLPDKLYNAFNSGDATMLAVFFGGHTRDTLHSGQPLLRCGNVRTGDGSQGSLRDGGTHLRRPCRDLCLRCDDAAVRWLARAFRISLQHRRGNNA